MKLYMDMCALKRPFDDQSQGRISMETHAVIRILHAHRHGHVQLCNSAALEMENAANPDAVRRGRVGVLLREFGRRRRATPGVLDRALDLRRRGVKDIDALHVASAEHQGADYFVTVDESILKTARRVRSLVFGGWMK